jgi:hypothetical protein
MSVLAGKWDRGSAGIICGRIRFFGRGRGYIMFAQAADAKPHSLYDRPRAGQESARAHIQELPELR